MKKIFLACFACILVACTNSGSEIKELKSEVIKIHDRTMSMRGTLMKTRKKLEAYRSTAADSATRIGKAINELTHADEQMMQWMRAFTPPAEMETSAEEKIAYLKEEKQKMRVIEEKTTEAIEFGTRVLANYATREEQADQQ